jgi:uncharacterized flavoprotein (TIGR03862 family)
LKKKKVIAIVGGGAAGIMTALLLSESYEVLLFEKERTLGRKFLVAGKGGFNLTNNADQPALIEAYSPTGFLETALNEFNANDLRSLLERLGVATYVGSSNRVFPKQGIKPAEVLKVLVDALNAKGVSVFKQHKLLQIKDRELVFQFDQEKQKSIVFDYCVLALGGASWAKTGSDGLWSTMLKELGVVVSPFQASNCGVNVDWPESFLVHHEGKPLKNIEVKVAGMSKKGEALITSYGLEGNAIYPIVKQVRAVLNKGETPVLLLDLKPNNSEEELLDKVRFTNASNFAKKLKLGTMEKSLLKHYVSREAYFNHELFVKSLKALPIPVLSLRPIEEAISTVGGVAIESLNADYSLKVSSRVFTIGEMVDWDAPTGGFLLQGCFAMANAVATCCNNRYS